MSERGVVGIDLGTSNTVLATAAPGEAAAVFEIPQVVAPGTIEARRALPSFLYLPNPNELEDGAIALPWKAEAKFVVGAFARDQGGKVPHRLVSSAKSWLCHDRVDRRSKILPAVTADEDVPRVSPVVASAAYLQHLRYAFTQSGEDPSTYDVVLTVPASFDPSARDLTLEAARAAGWPSVTLLEEPQAALYAWLGSQGDAWREQLNVGDTVLVCDVGGGTTDFSLISVGEQDGNLALDRVAVGDHILLGGDNMDWALGYSLKASIEKEHKVTLDRWGLAALVQAARAAKEALLAPAGPEEFPVVIPNRGARLFKKTLKASLTRAQVLTVLTDAFLPAAAITDTPQRSARTGLTVLGLPYAADAAITRHLAAFLSRHGGGAGFVKPSAVLFNGGVLRADGLQSRLVDILNGWLANAGAPPAKVLTGSELEVAVACGAVTYGQVRQGSGVRIRGGTARAYYVGVEQPAPAVPGFAPPLDAICVAAFGMEEGTEAALPDLRLGLWVGEPARFRFFGSTARRDDEVGHVLSDWSPEELMELPTIETTLTPEDSAQSGLVEVTLASAITPTGTLLLECVADEGARWKLEFNVRQDGEEDTPL